jgi:hypothetical protein
VNSPELGILDTEIKKVAHGRYILLPITDLTTGHGTHSNPAIWGTICESYWPLPRSPLARASQRCYCAVGFGKAGKRAGARR